MAHHVVWAVVIFVAYEAMVSLSVFFAVVARDVSSRWQARLADRVDLFLQRKGPRFERRYRQFVLDGLRFTDTKGLATVGPFTPEHDAVFVDVSLVPRPPQQIKPGLLPEFAGNRIARHVLGYFLDRAGPVVLAVVGAPGSGKTTLLGHAARQASVLHRSRKGRRNHVRDIPLLLYLRDHAAAIVAEPTVSVAALLRTTPGLAVEDEPDGWFEEQLKDGRCLVLLDGLDEVARPDDRVRVSAWAEAQIRRYPESSFVISSRPRGYQAAPVEGAEIVQVCGFTTSQIEDFVRGWYRAAERHSTGTAGPEAEALAARGAADLLQSLGQAPALYDLAVNPLLLTMIVNVHRYRGALPGSRVDLYSEICQVMLWRRQEAKQLSVQLSGDKKEAILRGMAYTMMERRVSDLSRTDVLAEVQPALRRMSRSVTPDDFLADASSNGLLIERETGQYAFAHKTFQEYLAATHIREQGLASVIANVVGDDWWVETTLLYTARSNADPIISACLKSGTAPALALALDCEDQGSEVDPSLRERLAITVSSAADPDSAPERRRLFAAILLRRYMRQRIHTSGGSQICPWPIPADIYRLFLTDTLTPEPDAPLEWTGIAAGMRGSDADAFVRWANDVSGAEQVYRLPLAAELGELAAQHPIPTLPSGHLPAVWTRAAKKPAGTSPVLWLAPGTPDPREVSKSVLASAVAEDAERSAPTLSAILLLRARILIYALNRALDHARDLNHAHDLDLARDLARALDRDLNRARDDPGDHIFDTRAAALADDIARAHDRNRELTQDPARELAQARELAAACDRELTQARARTNQITLDRNRARTQARSRKRERAQARTEARELARETAQASDPFKRQALDAARAGAIARANKLTLDRNRARTQARELGREITQARDLEREITRARDLAKAKVHDCTVVLDLAQANDRDHILALVRDLDRTCALAQARVVSYALDLDRAVARSLVDRHTDVTADDPAGQRGLDIARDIARDSTLARARGREIDRDSVLNLTIAISEASDRHVLWRSFSAPVLSIFDDAFGSLLGQIFSMAFLGNLVPASGSPGLRSATWEAVLSEAFTAATAGKSAGHITVDPAALEATLNESVKSLASILEKTASIPSASSWSAGVAERLQDSAGPVFTRTERPTAEKATASRIAALCLASEADGMERPDIGNMFRQLAAGITLLERRVTDQCPAPEVIILALDQSSFGMPASLGMLRSACQNRELTGISSGFII